MISDKDILIDKYTVGELSSEQEQELSLWLDASIENRSYFKARCTAYSGNHSAEGLKVLSQIRKSINERDRYKRLNERRSLAIRIGQIAAALIIGIFIKDLISINDSSLQEEIITEEIQFNIPLGQKSDMTLPDGSHVWLNSGSKISFSSNFCRDRKLSLEGEAYFEVQTDSIRPFHVEVNSYNVVAHGTSFNIMGYSNINRTEVSLLEGKLEIVDGDMSQFIEPSQRLTEHDGVWEKDSVDIETISSWKDNVFHLKNISFKELLQRLERMYDVKITMTNQDLIDTEFSGVFKNEETIWQVLDAIQYYYRFSYRSIGHREILIEKR